MTSKIVSRLFIACVLVATTACRKPGDPATRGSGSDQVNRTGGSNGSDDPTQKLASLRKEIDAELARQTAATNDDMHKADAKLASVIGSLDKLGLDPKKTADIKSKLESTKDPAGRSPGAHGALAGQAQAEGPVKTALEKAEKSPTPENIAEVKKALDDLREKAPQKREEGEKKEETSAIGNLLKTLGPVAAGAACMYFGGDPGTCAAVAKLVGQVLDAIFKTSEAGDEEQAAQVVQDGVAILSGTCDRACIEEKMRGWGLDGEQIATFVDKAMKEGGITSEDIQHTLDQAKQYAKLVESGIKCAKRFQDNEARKSPAAAAEALRGACQVIYDRAPEQAQKGINCFAGTAPDGTTFDAKDLHRVAQCLITTAGK